MNIVSRSLAAAIANSNGKFLTVRFTKKDGTTRTMNCRTGVTKDLRGGKSTLDADKFVTVYDMTKKGYRAIDRDSIISLAMDKQTAFIL